MEKLIIEGGKPLSGEVVVSGAKNAALPLIAATLLASGNHVLKNVPDLRDTNTILQLLENFGVSWRRDGDTLYIDTSEMVFGEASYDLVKTMRASVLVLGPLLARFGKARVSLPGGCAIGSRPIDLHLMGFEQLGAKCSLVNGYVDANVPNNKLRGGNICFDTPSVTATENILMAAVLADGITTISSAAKEPEIGNLVDMLISMGAKIEGKNTDLLVVHGVKELVPATYKVIADRIEAGTYLIAVAATGGQAKINNCEPKHLSSLLEKLRSSGFGIVEDEESIFITSPNFINNIDIKTMPYPGYPTDLQAQFMALMVLGDGVSIINETIFENRFMHVAELQRMGADIKIDARTATVYGGGPNNLKGAQVMATDLRASSSLVIAGLAASGRTEISRIYHLERGYEKMVEKLTGLGASVWKSK